MPRCPICNGRVIKTGEGSRCMSSACEGSKVLLEAEQACPKCGDPLHYKGLNSWGEPNYGCASCGVNVKL